MKPTGTVDVKLLYFLSEPHEKCTLKEIAEMLNITRLELSASIQKLLAKEMIVPVEKDRAKTRAQAKERQTEEKKKETKQKAGEKGYAVTQEAETVVSELLFVLCDLEQIQYEGFSPEERALYEELNDRRKRNIQNALRG